MGGTGPAQEVLPQACKMYIATLETVELPCTPVTINRIVG